MSTQAVPPTQALPLPPLEPPPALMDKAVCLVINRKWLPTSKTVSQSQFEVGEADKAMVHASKELYDSQELRAIFSQEARMDDFIKLKCLPSLFKRSVYLLPWDLFPTVEEALNQHLERRKPLIENFIQVYVQEVEKARELLKNLFNPLDYPAPDQVRNYFRFSWRYVQFGVDPKLAEMNRALYEREKQKAEAEWAEASEQIRILLRADMAELVAHMVERLTPGEEGKKKVLHKAMMDNIREFLSTFDARNLGNDVELKKLVEQAKALTAGITPDVIRSNDALRNSMQQGFSLLKTQLEKMISEAPARSMRFEEGE